MRISDLYIYIPIVLELLADNIYSTKWPQLTNYECQNTKKSPIHENADANITCDFGDGDISRYRSRFTHTGGQRRTHTRIATSIIVRFVVNCRCSVKS